MLPHHYTSASVLSNSLGTYGHLSDRNVCNGHCLSSSPPNFDYWSTAPSSSGLFFSLFSKDAHRLCRVQLLVGLHDSELFGGQVFDFHLANYASYSAGTRPA